MLRALVLGSLLFVHAAAQEKPVFSTPAEKQVVLEMSKARLSPKEFARWLKTQVPYFEGKVWNLPGRVPLETEEGADAVAELIVFLEHAPLDLGPLHWNEGLSRAARQWVLAQGPTGGTGHQGPDGSTLQSRVLKQGLFQSALGEVISYGPETPRWTVVQLLVDDGVPGRGHRKALFNPAFHVAGAATGPHTAYGEMTVVDLADAFVANP